MEIIWLTNTPSPYRVDFFNELGTNFDLKVLFRLKSLKDREKKWYGQNFINFKAIFLKRFQVPFLGPLNYGFLKYIIKNKGVIVVSDPMSITGALTIFIGRTLKKNIIIEGDGAFVKKENKIKYLIKKNILKGAIQYWYTNESHLSYYKNYNVKTSHLIQYPFSSMKAIDILDDIVTSSEKNILKKALNINISVVGIFVGQFIDRKGLDILIRCCGGMNQLSLILIGGTEVAYKEYLNSKKITEQPNIQILGFKSKSELIQYYKAADYLILPSREDIWGLVVNEAISYGLPVIVSNQCGSAEEIVKHNLNGYIFDINNPEELKKYVTKLNTEKNLRENMGRESLKIAIKYTIETMVSKHVEQFNILKRDFIDEL